MAKVILEFDSIEEAQDIQDALDGTKWKLAMWDLDQQLRGTTKYGASILDPSNHASEEEQKIAEKYREIIRDTMNSYNLNLD